MSEKLSEATARKTLPPVRGQTILWDGEVKGFALRVTPGGAKSFILDYRAEGRQRRITLGSWPDWTVAAARETAKTMKREVDLGTDPMGERRAQREAPTVLEMWDRYAREHLPKKAERGQADERMMWDKIILPRLGRMKVAAISHDDVDALHCSPSLPWGFPQRLCELRGKASGMLMWASFNAMVSWTMRCCDHRSPASSIEILLLDDSNICW